MRRFVFQNKLVARTKICPRADLKVSLKDKRNTCRRFQGTCDPNGLMYCRRQAKITVQSTPRGSQGFRSVQKTCRLRSAYYTALGFVYFQGAIFNLFPDEPIRDSIFTFVQFYNFFFTTTINGLFSWQHMQLAKKQNIRFFLGKQRKIHVLTNCAPFTW